MSRVIKNVLGAVTLYRFWLGRQIDPGTSITSENEQC